MRQITAKVEKYAANIRKNQRLELIAELRSKQLALLQSEYAKIESQSCDMMAEVQKGQVSFLKHLFLKDESIFIKIKTILNLIIEQSITQKEKLSQECINKKNIIEHILSSAKDDIVLIQNNLSQNQSILKLSVVQLKECFIVLSKLICKLVNVININIAKIHNYSTNSRLSIQIYYETLQKIQQCHEIQLINYYCSTFLYVYCSMIQNIEYCDKESNIILLITDCLIESSCFKPRKLLLINGGDERSAQMVNEINERMCSINKGLNEYLCNALIPIICCFRYQEKGLKLFINYIYIIGNIFINFNSLSFKNQQSKSETYHNSVLNKFINIIMQIHQKIEQVDSQLFKSRQSNQSFMEICSLMIWFIRNEVLIMQGMFNLKRCVPEHSQIDNIVNQYWMKILKNVFGILHKVYINRFDQYLGETQVNLLIESISLLQVMYYDYQLNQENIDTVIQYLKSFQNFIKVEIPYHAKLHRVIYDFYFGLVCTRNNSEKVHEQIYFQTISALKYSQTFSVGLKLCSKILSAQSKFSHILKLQLYTQMCNNFQAFFQMAKGRDNYDQKVSLASLIFSAISERHFMNNNSNMIAQFLNQSRVRKTLELCSMIWEEQKHIEDLIESLELVKQLSDREEFSSLIKYCIENAGYYEQLELLSENTNEDINRLVYEIYELLELM